MATIITCIILAVIVGLAIVKIIRDRKNRKKTCTGDCSSCGRSCNIH